MRKVYENEFTEEVFQEFVDNPDSGLDSVQEAAECTLVTLMELDK